MRIYQVHSEANSSWQNACVVADNEQKAIEKFRELFRLDSSVPIRIEYVDLSGILVI